MKTILIADEDERAKNIVRLMFEHKGYRVVATGSGVDTTLKAKEIKPDIVFADVSLSDKNGYEVSREIKNDLLLKNTPVLLLTSSLGAFDETRAAESHADDFIIKPFKSEEITKKVEFFTRRGVESFISQNKERKITFVEAMLVLLVIFMVTAPILYQIVNVNLTKVESKPMPADEGEKKEVVISEIKEEGVKPRLIIEPVSLSESEQPGGGEVSRKEEIKDIAAVPVTQPNGKYTVQTNSSKAITQKKSEKEEPAFEEVRYRLLKEIRRKIDVKKLELVTDPVSASELGQPDGEEVSKEEEIKASLPEKKEALEEPKKVEVKKAAVPTIEPGGKYTVQIGAFQKEEEAKKIAESLKLKGYPVFVKTAEVPGKGTWHRVRIGTFKTREEAKLYGDNLKGREPLIKEVVLETEKEKKKEPTLEDVYGLLKEIQKKLEE